MNLLKKYQWLFYEFKLCEEKNNPIEKHLNIDLEAREDFDLCKVKKIIGFYRN